MATACSAEMEPRWNVKGADQRADGAARSISFDNKTVLIARSVAGIKMRLTVPVRAYCGLALAEAGTHWCIVAVHADAELSFVLEAADGEHDALVMLAHWAGELQLPVLDRPADAAGQMEMGRGLPQRRRGAQMSKRRPRFLLRRKNGQLARTSISFSGEREIIWYE